MRCVTLPGGDVVPSMGQGTWKMGERPSGDPMRLPHYAQVSIWA